MESKVALWPKFQKMELYFEPQNKKWNLSAKVTFALSFQINEFAKTHPSPLSEISVMRSNKREIEREGSLCVSHLSVWVKKDVKSDFSRIFGYICWNFNFNSLSLSLRQMPKTNNRTHRHPNQKHRKARKSAQREPSIPVCLCWGV